MIRIIIPTMWKYPPFWDFAESFLKVDVVSEIFIINNDTSNTPALDWLQHPKVKIVSFGKNILVNPSWNCGAMGSKSDILCVVNDDFIFDIRVLYKAATFITANMGCLCLSEQIVEDGKVPVKTGNIQFTPYTGQSTWGYGVLFFIHKDNWIDIPPDLLLCYGDNFVFDQCMYRGLQNYMIDELFHYHAGAQTNSIITENGKLDNIYINREAEVYFNKILPQLKQLKV